MKNSAAHRHLQKVATILGGRVSKDFYGITVGKHRLLYRHGLGWSTESKGTRYQQFMWTRPFGSPKDRAKIDLVLLHAEKRRGKRVRNIFFLYTRRKATQLAEEFPRVVNLAAEPIRIYGPKKKIWAGHISRRVLIKKLAGASVKW